MSSLSEDLTHIKECGVIAIVRTRDPEEMLAVAQAALDGGIRAVEFPITCGEVLAALPEAVRVLSQRALVGAGTVLDEPTARQAILAGARFIVSPTFVLPVLRTCQRYGVLSIPGALTPTEVMAAWEQGANMVKVFPAGCLGPGYIRDLLSPFPYLSLVPTGGVGPENAAEYLKAGAAAVAVGGSLTNPKGEGDRLAMVRAAAEGLVSAVAKARRLQPD